MARLASRLPGHALHALIESPLGVESAFEIASAGIGLGEADLRSALGVATAEHLGWQRARIVNAAAAAGLEPPAMSVYADVRDLEGLRASCEAGRASGFVGRAAIHPAQLPVIREAFTPSAPRWPAPARCCRASRRRPRPAAARSCSPSTPDSCAHRFTRHP